MSSDQYDLVVIGGGPAGYAAAIKACQLGKKVACIEVERAGGTCLNWGCIPSKALLKAAELYQSIQKSENFGITAKEVSIDFKKIIARSRSVANTMGKGIEFLFKKNQVEYILGHGRINTPGMVEITSGKEAGRYLTTKNILIATGCKPKQLPHIEVDGKAVMTSRELLANTKQPKSLAILGAGAIGVEFAYFFNSMSTEVTLVEMLPNILPIEDEEISKSLAVSFKKQGIQLKTSTLAESVKKKGKHVELSLKSTKDDSVEQIKVDAVLMAIGVSPNIEGLLSDKINLEFDRGFIQVDENYQTTLSSIYAAGDIIGPPWLAHVATYEALQAVNAMFDIAKVQAVKNVPGCTYCQPQVASIGMTEEAAKKKNIDYKVGKFPFTASGKAVAIDHPEGFVKIITDKTHGEVLGAHIIGYEATEMISEFGMAMGLEATHHEIHNIIHAHPTLSEAIMEAAAAVDGKAIHI